MVKPSPIRNSSELNPDGQERFFETCMNLMH